MYLLAKGILPEKLYLGCICDVITIQLMIAFLLELKRVIFHVPRLYKKWQFFKNIYRLQEIKYF